ncbi:pyridoxal phosphate-dependent aminotransferase [Spirochaeta thermophila]|uniref:Aminotransferase class I/classII large domain-containing protein n=1 Tax=Winmispira thermophila (strain ATCC 49972 / DSM 6192 / RI 19.B1) TaxID=665571 RepID=E0RSC9_WINT6|nr:histidinol-phosphate transaminase [Spirochaeta thermophila]ADN01916.1 hypothetical protein STHERM_c09700 [Spirochaeta thermophila DSM 6192]
MSITPRKALQDVPRIIHGGLHGGSSRLLDFSVNLNPFPIPRVIRRAVIRGIRHAYPDTAAALLIDALSTHLSVPSDWLMALNGTSEGILLLSLCYLSPGDSVLIVSPTYQEYERAALLMEARVHHHRLEERALFGLHTERLEDDIRRIRPRLLWIGSPNNPTATHLTQEQVREILSVCESTGTLFILDEAYANFLPSGPLSPLQPFVRSGHLAVLRSMTKDYLLTPLRLGYIVAHPDIISTLKKAQPPWSVNIPAQEAGRAAIRITDVFARQWRAARNLARDLRHAIESLGYPTIPSECNFFLSHVGDSSGITAALQTLGVVVRDCSSFGLPSYIRIGTRTARDNALLIRALRHVGRKRP